MPIFVLKKTQVVKYGPKKEGIETDGSDTNLHTWGKIKKQARQK